MGKPGKRWNVELTKKNVSPIRVTDGSGAKPGIIGLTVAAMLRVSEMFSYNFLYSDIQTWEQS